MIATYNRCADLKECLTSIFALNTPPYEVIVVDSDSKDGTAMMQDLFPLQFISISERNRERARNIGISATRGDIVAFLDDDVVVSSDWLSQITKPYSCDDVGGVGGRVIPYGTRDETCMRLSRSEVGRVFKSGLVIGNFDTLLKDPVEVDSLIGCNMSFRKELLLRIHGFDENYTGTGYRDDTDVCMQIRKLGYRLVYHPNALVFHKFRGKEVDSKWAYWYVRNHTYFYFKNLFSGSEAGFPQFVYRMLFPPRYYVMKSGIKIKIEPTLLLSVFKGLFDGYRTWERTCKD